MPTITARPILSLYLDTSEPSTTEFNALIDDMERRIRATFTEAELQAIKDQYAMRYRLLGLDALEPVLCRSRETLSTYRNGHAPVPPETMYLTRLLHHRVCMEPELGRVAFLDFHERMHGKPLI